MKITTPIRHTLRFRRWSRKAYAAFASIGRCVSIGCLRKNVADSSLSKQKAVGAAGQTSCNEDSVWNDIAKAREKDEETEPKIMLQMIIATQVAYPYAHTNEEVKLIQQQRSNTSTDYQELSSTFIRLLHADNPCLFYAQKP